MEDNQSRLERIKKFVGDNGELFTFENDLKWLVSMAEKTEEYNDAVGYWINAHREACDRLNSEIAVLKRVNSRISTNN